ncbi:ribonuclease E/G [Oceanicella actignis]|uniref:ribonuclease E/G n=1 Tax=Oceanicella actignis TaxID=1189325 RepID=UPI0011E87168|nr:ribonuclease E/G [Oceanicella actignis]TYO90019.1 Rne/Rng family ribonuclease [Oceanicella actignis]
MNGRAIVILDDPDLPAMAALTEGGRLIDLLIDPPEDDPTPRPGAIHMARVTRLAPAMGAVFVDLGEGREGFLKGVKGLRAGDWLAVQISRHAEPGKAVPVSAEPLFKGRYAIVTPHAPGLNVARKIRNPEERARLTRIAQEALERAGLSAGLVVRTAAEGAAEAEIAEDVEELAALARLVEGAPADAPAELVAAPDAEVLAWRDWVDPEPERVLRGDSGLFDDLGLLDQIEALLSPRVPLPGGAWMTIEPTAAMVCVDVNTGADFSPASALKANLAALEDLPRQLRLRGLGGQITVDAAPCSKRDRPKLEAALKRALKSDPVETTVAGWTPLGNLELLRKRERRPIAELLRAPLERTARGRGRR